MELEPQNSDDSFDSAEEQDIVRPLNESMFIITNIDTGESVDIRAMNKENFIQDLSRMTLSEDYEYFYTYQRKLNERLWTCAEKNEYELIKTLLTPSKEFNNMIADLTALGLHDYTALHFAADAGAAESIEVILRLGEQVQVYMNARTFSYRTPLILSVIQGHNNWVEQILSAGWDVNLVDSEGSTASHYAAQYGHKNILEMILGYDPNLSIKNNIGQTPYDVSSSYEIMSTFKNHFYSHDTQLISDGYGRFALGNCILHNSRHDMVSRILAKMIQPMPSQNTVEQFYEQKASMITASTFGGTFRLSSVGPDDFEILGKLGKGSFGVIYLVKWFEDDKEYAMKVLRKADVIGRDLVRYAFTEKNILSDFNCDFIIKLHYAFQTSEKLIMVIDYWPRGDLGEHIRYERRFSEQRTRVYLAEIIIAIEYLHEQNVMFRDLKPENVLVDVDGHVKLADFGLAKKLDHGDTSKSFCGSLAYLAPEMMAKKGHTKMIDWYLLGVFAYEMLTGRPPFYSRNKDELLKNIQKAPLQIPGYLTPIAGSLLRGLLSRDVKKRLGYKTGSQEIRDHPFFKNISWEMVIKKELIVPKPPKKPVLPDIVSTEDVFGQAHRDVGNVPDWSFIE